MIISRRRFVGAATAFSACAWAGGPVASGTGDWAERLVGAARKQIGVTTIYDPSYVRLDYPMGDVPAERGVCTDVVVRAYRDAFDLDLQQLVHEDMKRYFGQYPDVWGLSKPDRNIDHRRVLNLKVFFDRKGAGLPVTQRAGDYLAGDIVAQVLPGNLPHMAIVSDDRGLLTRRPLIIHNIGAGTRLEDGLFAYPITGHYRFAPALSPV
jgi:uncharacterized protein YijF (DUF1287 family)